MGEELSWSVRLKSASGVSVGDTGAVEIEAVMIAPAELEPNMADPIELDLQLGDVDKVSALLISSSVYGGEVDVEGDHLVKLTGPLLLYGDAIKLFAASLEKIKVRNNSDKKAELQILIGRRLTS